MWVDTAPDIDRDGKSSSQDLSYAGRVFNARWGCGECCWYCGLGWCALDECQPYPSICLIYKRMGFQGRKKKTENIQLSFHDDKSPVESQLETVCAQWFADNPFPSEQGSSQSGFKRNNIYLDHIYAMSTWYCFLWDWHKYFNFDNKILTSGIA